MSLAKKKHHRDTHNDLCISHLRVEDYRDRVEDIAEKGGVEREEREKKNTSS